MFKRHLFTRAIFAENGLFVFKFGVISKECVVLAIYGILNYIDVCPAISDAVKNALVTNFLIPNHLHFQH